MRSGVRVGFGAVVLLMTASCGTRTVGLADGAGTASDQKKVPPAADASPSLDLQPDLPVPADRWVDLFEKFCKKFSGYIGKTCTSDSDCTGGGTDYFCLRPSSSSGLCTVTCTPDDPETPLVSEDTCPSAGLKAGTNICAPLPLSSGKTGNGCYRVCAPRLGCTDCDKGFACDPASGAALELYGIALCLSPACTKDSDCPVETSAACTPSATPTGCGAGESCQPYWSYVDSSGSTKTSSSGLCAKPGTCTKSGLCDKKPASLSSATAQVGDPCKDDTECGQEMKCLMEIDESKHFLPGGAACVADSQCCGGSCNRKTSTCDKGLCVVRNRNGYCTIEGCTFSSTLTGKKCPAGSTCNNAYPGGNCQLRCDMSVAKTCRGSSKDLWGDYECLGWDTPGWSTTPVCDTGVGWSCSVFASANTSGIDAGPPKYDCASFFGDSMNSTNMACRTLDGAKTADKWDPSGFCFDDTGSGTSYRSPTPLLPDAAAAPSE
jgi:hypothetical protein